MAKSDQDPSVERGEDAEDNDASDESSAKSTLLGIGERLRQARESGGRKASGSSDASGPPKGPSGTNLSIPTPRKSVGSKQSGPPAKPDDIADTPPDGSPAHRRTAALSQHEAHTAAQDDEGLEQTGPQTIEMSGEPDDSDDAHLIDEEAILETEPVDEMEGEATMLSDSLFPADDAPADDAPTDDDPADDQGPDPNYDVGKTEVSIQSLDDFEAEHGAGPDAQTHDQPDDAKDKHTRQQFADTPATGQSSGSFPEPADTPADRPSRRGQQNPTNPPTPEAGRSGQFNRPDASSSQPAANPERSSRAFPKSPTPREEQPGPMGDTPESGVQQPVEDFEDEKTEVFNSPYEREAVVPKLSALNGPSAGQEFLLNKMRNSVGRGNNNTVMVPDLAMSRRHFEIAKNPDESFTLRDLQSANGTVLNETSVKEGELFHGDRIEAGKTTFQFLHPDQQRRADEGSRHLVPAGGTQPSAPMKASSGQNRTVSDKDRTGQVLNYVIIIAVALSVVLAVPVVYLLFFHEDTSTAQQPSAESLAKTGASQDLIALYLEGVNAVKDREWKTAQERFEEVKAMDPDFERVNQQLARIRREKTHMQRLEKAQSLADQGEVAEAATFAEKINQNSVYFEQAQSLIRRLKRVDIDARYQKAVTAFGEDEFDTALNHVNAVLEEVPEHQGALELKDKLETTIAENEAEAKAEAEAEEQERRAAADTPTRTRRPQRDRDDSKDESADDGLFDLSGDWSGGESDESESSAGGGGSADFSKGYSLYESKNFTAAAAYFGSIARKQSGSDARKAEAAAAGVKAFQSSYESANSAYSQGNYDSAIRGYTKARALDKKVSSSGYFQSQLGNQLANSYGKRGLAELRKSQYSNAYDSYRSGKRYSSSNSTLRTLGAELSDKARSLYIQAVNKRSSDPAQARSLCNTITSMIAPSEQTYQKAKKLMNEL